MNVRNIGKLKIPNSLFAENRTKIVNRMRDLEISEGQIFLQGGKLAPIYDTDMELDFHQEDFFTYLFGYDGDGAYGSVDIKTGKSFLFVQRISDSFSIWVGPPPSKDFYKDKYGVDEVYYTDDICKILDGQQLYLMDGVNSDSGIKAETVKFEGIDKFKTESTKLYDELQECRVIKTKAEFEIYKEVVKYGVDAHLELMKQCKPGLKEYELEAIYQYHMLRQNGCRYFAFPPIIGSGKTSATLHYFANKGTLKDGELVCCDIGLDYSGFKSDITISIPVNGKFTEDQKILYNCVLKANRKIIDKMKEGIHWTDMHGIAYRSVLEGMIELGVLNKKYEVEEMIDADIGYCFMPHGLGHFLGLTTHDCGGYNKYTPEREKKKGWSSLRTARTLVEGMLITVEPGCYFNPILIENYLKDEKTKKFFVEEKIKKYYDFGGVRIEDDVFVTKNGCVVLSEGIPRTVEEIEEFMKK